VRYLDRLRATATAEKVLVGGTAPTKLTNPPNTLAGVLTKPTKPSFVSSAATDPHAKDFAKDPVTCSGCRYFRSRPGSQPDGACDRFGVETWSAVPFTCDGFEAQDAAVRALEARRSRVEGELRAHPELRIAFEAVDAPLSAGPAKPVSVMIAVRHGEQIVSCEMRVPRERWDAAAILRTVTETSKRAS